MDIHRSDYLAARRWRSRCIGVLAQRGWRRLVRRCRATLAPRASEATRSA